jgi:hypothetical protein
VGNASVYERRLVNGVENILSLGLRQGKRRGTPGAFAFLALASLARSISPFLTRK